jgi:hypothetical protein
MSAAFDAVFGVFVALILALAVISVRWAVQRDRIARARREPRAVEEPHPVDVLGPGDGRPVQPATADPPTPPTGPLNRGPT